MASGGALALRQTPSENAANVELAPDGSPMQPATQPWTENAYSKTVMDGARLPDYTDDQRLPDKVEYLDDPNMLNAQPYWGDGRTHGNIAATEHVKAVCSHRNGKEMSGEYPCVCGSIACKAGEVCNAADGGRCEGVTMTDLDKITRGRGVPGLASGQFPNLFSKGTTRMACFPLIATRLEVLSYASHELPFYEGITLIILGLAAAITACCGVFNKEAPPRQILKPA